jgi:hypothetical protein
MAIRERRRARPQTFFNRRVRPEPQVIYEMALRILQDPKTRQEKLTMDNPQVVFEYGKLHLNYLALQQSFNVISGKLAEANKGCAALAVRIEELEKEIKRLEDGTAAGLKPVNGEEISTQNEAAG